MPYSPIERNPQGCFILDEKKIVDNDKLEIKWPDGGISTVIVRLVGGELRIAGSVHGVKCWIVLDYGIKKHEVLACRTSS